MKVLTLIPVLLVLALLGCTAIADTAPEPVPMPTSSVPTSVASPATPIPQVVPTATPLPSSPRTVYIIDSNEGERISRILSFDPDRPRQKGTFSTRYTPDLAFSPDGRRMYVADTYWTQVTRGEVKDVLSVYDPATGYLLLDDHPIPHRMLYKFYPLGDPNLFFSGDGSLLFSMRHDNPIRSKQLVAIMDAKTLEVLHQGPTPHCGHRIQALSDEWICGNLEFPPDIPPDTAFSTSLHLDVVDPWSGENLETLLTVEDLKQGLSSLASTPDGDRLYMIDREAGVTTVDLPDRRFVGRVKLDMSEEPRLIHGAVSVTPDGGRLFLGVATGDARDRAEVTEIWVYDTENWERLTKIRMRDPVMHFTFSVAGDQLYAVSPVGQTFTIYDADTYQEITRFDELGGTLARVVVPGAGG